MNPNETTPEAPAFAPPTQPGVPPFGLAGPARTTEGAACKACGYALSGLSPEGNCPECGLAIERSLTDDMLANSAPGYVASLKSGLSLVLNGILLMVVLVIVAMGAGMALAAAGSTTALILLVVSGLFVVASLMMLVGWWKFSEPDPAFTGREDASKSRGWVRGASVAHFGVTLLSTVVALVPSIPAGVDIVLTLLGYAVFGVQYFASMLYLRWLTPRIPNWKAWKRAKTMMWLGPVLAIPGSIVLIGPLIALILYWNMLDWVRKDLKKITAAQRAV